MRHLASSTAALLALLVLAAGVREHASPNGHAGARGRSYRDRCGGARRGVCGGPPGAYATYRDAELGVQGSVTEVTEPWPATPRLFMAGTAGVDIVCEFRPGTIRKVRAHEGSEIVLLSTGNGFDGNARLRDCHIRDSGNITRPTATPPYPPATPLSPCAVTPNPHVCRAGVDSGLATPEPDSGPDRPRPTLAAAWLRKPSHHQRRDRPQEDQHVYNDTRVLDVHSHIRPLRPGYLFFNDLVHSRLPLESPIGPGKHSGIAGMRDEDFQASAAGHASYLDERNIDTQILTPHPLRVFGWLEPYLFEAWVRYCNDMIFKIAQAQPERFVGACILPQNAQAKDTSNCIEELERCVLEYGFAAAFISPDISGKRDSPAMSEPYWYPLYEKCQELGVPIVVHGTDGLDPRYRSLPTQYYQMTFLTEQYMALATLRQNDQFERFPGLKVVVCHCGGALDRHIGDYAWLCKDRDNSQNLFYDTCSYDLDFLATAIKQKGVSQMCFGVEAPGGGVNNRPGTDRTADDMVPMITEHPTLSFLTEQDKMDILHHNPAKVCPPLVDPVAANARTKVTAYDGSKPEFVHSAVNPWGFSEGQRQPS